MREEYNRTVSLFDSADGSSWEGAAEWGAELITPDPAGERFFVSTGSNGMISVIDAPTGETTSTIGESNVPDTSVYDPVSATRFVLDRLGGHGRAAGLAHAARRARRYARGAREVSSSMRALLATAVASALAWLLGLEGPLGIAAKSWPALALALVVVRVPTPFARGVAVGLGLSSVGDALLEVPGAFVPGLGAFLLAHVAYTIAFVRDERRAAPTWAAAAYAYGVGMFTFLGPSRLGEMLVPVGLYVVALTTMVWRAAARLGRPGAAVAAVGAVVFAGSDTLIALNLFAGVEFPGRELAVMLTYWGAQGMIAWGATRR